jgi:hypothetical protein
VPSPYPKSPLARDSGGGLQDVIERYRAQPRPRNVIWPGEPGFDEQYDPVAPQDLSHVWRRPKVAAQAQPTIGDRIKQFFGSR